MAGGFLSREENTIFATVKGYFEKNNAFRMKEVVSFIKINLNKTLNLDDVKIEIILHSLLKKNLISPTINLNIEDILKNNTRKEIFHYIEEHPGSHFNEIAKNLKLGNHQTAWHLNFLKKYSIIRTAEIDNREVYFKQDSNSKFDKLYYYMKNKRIKSILNNLKEKKQGAKPTIISTELKMHYNTLKKYLEILKDLSLVSSKINNNRVVYTLNSPVYETTLENLQTHKK